MGSFRVFYLVIIALMLPMFASCGRLGTAGSSGVTHVSDVVSVVRPAHAPDPSAGNGLYAYSSPRAVASMSRAAGGDDTGAHTATSM